MKLWKPLKLTLQTCLDLGKTFPTLDPRTGEVIAHVAEGDKEDINRAVSAARKAFDEGPWPKMSPYVLDFYFLFPFCFLWQLMWNLVDTDTHARTHPHTYQWPGRYFHFKMCSKTFLTLLSMFYFVQERSKIIYRFADLLEKHKDELAALEVWDAGKPYEQAASAEIPTLVRLFRYYAGGRHWIWSTNYFVRFLILSSCICWHRLSRASFSWLGSKESLCTWWCLLVIIMSANVDHICTVRITLLV